jgi:hypothetical protein
VRRGGIIVAVVLVAVACRTEGVTLVSDADLPPDVYGSPGPVPTVSPLQLPEEGTIFLVRNGRLHPQVATLQDELARSLPEALLLALITAQPQGRGVTSEIPRRTRLSGTVEVDGTVATVDLSSEFEQGTEQSLALRIAQVVYTLTEDTGILGVEFEVEGFPAPVVEPDRPANRVDFREFAPQGSG